MPSCGACPDRHGARQGEVCLKVGGVTEMRQVMALAQAYGREPGLEGITGAALLPQHRRRPGAGPTGVQTLAAGESYTFLAR